MRSAGLLPYRLAPGVEVLIAHPGGPFWARRDQGAWSVVKGLIETSEDDEAAAAREFTEETGWPPPPRPWIPLGETKLRSGKEVVAFAAAADYRPESLSPGSFLYRGRRYPEIDRVEWFDADAARTKLNPAQAVFIDRLLAHLSGKGTMGTERG